MKKVFLLQDLLDAIHDCQIIINHNGLKIEITEQAFLAGLDHHRNNFEIDLYYVQSGDHRIAVLNSIKTQKKLQVQPRVLPTYKRRWWMAAATLFA